jgi:hypothetical protein
MGVRHDDCARLVGERLEAAKLRGQFAQPGRPRLDLGVDQLERARRPSLELPHQRIPRGVPQSRRRVGVHEQVPQLSLRLGDPAEVAIRRNIDWDSTHGPEVLQVHNQLVQSPNRLVGGDAFL